MAAVQQAAYVAMSTGHSYRWRVGRRSSLKHNLTFPPYYIVTIQKRDYPASVNGWAKISFKGKLLTTPGIFSPISFT